MTEPTNDIGYLVTRILNDEDLQELKKRVNSQIKLILQQVDPDIYALIKDSEDPLKVYHKIEPNNRHGSNWIKHNRLLSQEDANWFENSNSISKLRSSLGAVRVSDEENIGISNYYWRLTRPWSQEDIGPIHRDEWFWILNNNFNESLRGLKRIKVWIAIQTEPGKNGLLVQPDSHKRTDLKWEGKNDSSIIKPILLTRLEPNSMKLLHTPPGSGVIFHDKLLHGGALNKADNCRCSIEFTMLIPAG